MTKQEMINELQSRNVRVVFTKKDGTIRDLTLTLKDLPFDMGIPSGRRENETKVNAFDFHSQSWKSFDINRLVSFT